MLNKLFAKLNITSTHQFILVNIVFAITGTLSVLVAGPIMELFGIGSSSYGEMVYWVIRIFLIFFFIIFPMNLFMFNLALIVS